MTQTQTSLSPCSIDLVIFDCDGVLIDSEILSKRVLLAMLEDLGVSISDSYFDSYFLGQSFKSVTARVLTDYSVTLTEQFRENYLASIETLTASD